MTKISRACFLASSKITTITCAFCKGKGKDPFEIMSSKATCQVCGGRGKIAVAKPYVVCAHCQGTGVSPGSRNVCTVCNGRGVVSVTDGRAERDGKKVCPKCHGSGCAAESNLPCLTCGGRGVVKNIWTEKRCGAKTIKS